jgi:hypothetical protein
VQEHPFVTNGRLDKEAVVNNNTWVRLPPRLESMYGREWTRMVAEMLTKDVRHRKSISWHTHSLYFINSMP